MSASDFLGPTSTLVLRNLVFANEKNPIRPISTFFAKPYESPLQALGRTTSIFTDPLIIEGLALVSASVAVGFVFSSIINLVRTDLKEAGSDLKKAGMFLFAAVGLVALGVLSPLINLVDLIISGAKMLTEKPTAAPAY